MKSKLLFKDYFKKGYWAISLIFAAAFCGLGYLFYHFDLFAKITEYPKFELYSIITVGFFTLCLLLYIVIGSARKKLSCSLAFGVALMISALAAALFYHYSLKEFNLARMIAVIVLGVCGILSFILANVKYDPENYKPMECKCKFKPIAYICNTFSKFGVLTCMLYFAFAISLAFLCFNTKVQSVFSQKSSKYTVDLVVAIAMAAFILLDVIFSMFNRKLNHIDALFIGFFPVMAFTGMQIHFMAPWTLATIIVFAAISGLYFILLILRIVLVKFDRKENQYPYFKGLFSNYMPTHIVALAAVTAGTLALTYGLNVYNSMYNVIKGTQPGLILLPFFVVNVISALALVVMFASGFFRIDKRRIIRGDVGLWACLFTCIFIIAVAPFSRSQLAFIVVAAFLLILAVGYSIFRAIIYNMKEKPEEQLALEAAAEAAATPAEETAPVAETAAPAEETAPAAEEATATEETPAEEVATTEEQPAEEAATTEEKPVEQPAEEKPAEAENVTEEKKEEPNA